MKVSYYNTKHPVLIRTLIAISIVLGIACAVLWVKLDRFEIIFMEGFFIFTYSIMPLSYFLREYTIDTADDTIIDHSNKKYPLRVSAISKITYYESRKGKFRRLTIHDRGVGFMNIYTSKDNADMMISQLLEANPAIEVKHSNYP